MAEKVPARDAVLTTRVALEHARLSRLTLLRRGGAAALGVGLMPTLLAACGGGDDEGGGGEAPEASGTIDYLSWTGYDVPDPMKAWKQANQVRVKPTYIGNHDDIQAKIKAGGGSYDLITYYQGYKDLYTELDILSVIDTDKIPNIEGLFTVFKEADARNLWIEEDDDWTGVPWTWGSIGITWDDARLPGGLSSWDDLLDPKFKGKVAMVNDPLGAFTLTCHILGKDPAALPKDEYSEIRDYLEKMVAQAKTVSPGFTEMTTALVNGEAVVCFQGWAYQNYLAAQAGNKTVKTKTPDEGAFSFCDLYAIPTTTDNADTVDAWINEALAPETNARIAEYLVAAVTVEASVDLINADTKALYPYDDLELGDSTGERLSKLFELAPFYGNPPIESDEFVTFSEMQEGWEEIKQRA
jgi:spermidine/putrescine transport system substrate-binding protein